MGVIGDDGLPGILKAKTQGVELWDAWALIPLTDSCGQGGRLGKQVAAAVSVHATSPSAPHPKLVANERSILEKTEHPAKGERSYFCENQGPAAFFSNSSVGWLGDPVWKAVARSCSPGLDPAGQAEQARAMLAPVQQEVRRPWGWCGP